MFDKLKKFFLYQFGQDFDTGNIIFYGEIKNKDSQIEIRDEDNIWTIILKNDGTWTLKDNS